jgi:hypothetical protein
MRLLKAVPNEVRFKVRHHALLLNRFTVDQIVAATGLNRLSVRTELQRLKREGYLTVTRQKGARSGPGAPLCLYQIVPDPEKALELAESVAAFYQGTATREILRPEGSHFRVAARIIQDVTTKPLAEPQRQTLLTEAAEHLDFAEVEESARREGREAIQGYIALERGKLAALRGNLAEATRHFQESQAAFQAANQSDKAGEARDWLLCIQLRREGFAPTVGETARDHLARFADAIGQILGEPRDLFTDNPFAQILAELAASMTQVCQPSEDWRVELRKHVKEAAREGTSEAMVGMLGFAMESQRLQQDQGAHQLSWTLPKSAWSIERKEGHMNNISMLIKGPRQQEN